MKILFVVLILFVFRSQISAQKMNSCCTSSTAKFASFASDKNFTASHLAPLPFTYQSEKGSVVTFKTDGDVDGRAFEVKPEAATKNFLFVIHEWWGLNDYIKREAERLQKELGNVNVLALDLYDGKVAATPEEASKYVRDVKEDRARAIIQGAIRYAGADARIATIGWCFGGGWSMQSSLMAEKQGIACVIYYGMPEMDQTKLSALHSPVLGIFAKKDEWVSPKVVKDFESAMKKSKKQLTVKSFDAVHAFANPSNPKYDKKSADEANKISLAFLKKYISGK